jgi:hypothetical protein
MKIEKQLLDKVREALKKAQRTKEKGDWQRYSALRAALPNRLKNLC